MAADTFRDHASLPDNFDETAAAIKEKQRAKPVDPAKKGQLCGLEVTIES